MRCHDAPYPRGDDGIDTRWGPTEVAARLEIHVKGRAGGASSGPPQRCRLSVGSTGPVMIGLGDDPLTPGYERADHRVGAGAPFGTPGQLDTAQYQFLIDCGGPVSRQRRIPPPLVPFTLPLCQGREQPFHVIPQRELNQILHALAYANITEGDSQCA